jgi:PilZ domain-containing protein
MPSSSATPPSFREQLTSDEHREWVRVDDHLLLEYRLVSDRADVPPPGLPPVTQEMVAAAVGKPTADLLARSGEMLAGSPLLPWIMKVDWLLEVMLKAMAAQHPECMAIARMTEVNISGGGISFVSPRRFAAGDRLAMKVILPPFTPVQTIAQVIRSDANDGGFLIATQFENLPEDDQDHIVRHVIQLQAERLRARRNGGG